MEPKTNTALEQLYKSIQTFGSLTMAAENREKLYQYSDAFMQSLHSILGDDDCDDTVKMEYFNSTMEQYADAMRELFPKLLAKTVADNSPRVIGKEDPNRFDEIEEIGKFNPYHDSKGRFATSSGYASFTIRTKDPSKQHMADMAIAREKDRASGGGSSTPTPKKPPKPKKPANPTGDPDTIGGAKRGEPMSREEANNSNANPNFMKAPGYNTNCQSCVVAYEARLRGYDVQTKSYNNNPAAQHLARATADAWIDPATGKTATMLRNDPSTVRTVKQTRQWMEDTIQTGERYTFRHGWKGRSRTGHIISADKDSSGALRLYDPQTGKTYTGSDVDGYLKNIKTTTTVYGTKLGRLGLTRVDNMRINPQYADGIMEARK